MNAEDFAKSVHKNTNNYYGICPPPINAQVGMNILIKHFLGEDWYVALPINTEQVNAEAVYQILKSYPNESFLNESFLNESFWKRFIRLIKS